MNWFKDIHSLDELRKLYRRLVVRHHPDNGGSEEIIKEINAEYDILFKRLKEGYEKSEAYQKATERQKQTYDSVKDQKLRDMIIKPPEQHRGIVLRHGDRAVYFHLFWDLKYSGNPLLLVDDFDGDGKPEAALVLGEGGGTGCYVECLYIIDLDTMTYTVPDYSEIPLDITYNPEKTLAKLSSGDQEQEVDLTELVADGFQGRVEVGNQVEFYVRDGRMYCCLTPDFYCNTLGYLVSVDFPVVYEDGTYRLGEAVSLTGTLPD